MNLAVCVVLSVMLAVPAAFRQAVFSAVVGVMPQAATA